MRLYNKSKRTYQHSYYDKDNKLVVLNLKPGQNLDNLPKDVAKLWLSTGDIVEYVDPAEAKEKETKAEAQKAKLEAENAKLKAEIEKLKAEAKEKETKAKAQE